jgi:ABC-type multidrug transport system fused ATPase/permease subunit/CRP-like cAMP-binding protein
VKQNARWFLQYLYPAHRGILIALWVTGLVAAALSLVGPRVVGHLTNLFTHGQVRTTHEITSLILLLVASQVLFAAVSYWRKWMELRLQETVSRTLMLETFSRVVRFSADFFRDREVEKINSRILDDANTAGRVIVTAAVMAPVALMSMAVFAGVMLAQNLFLGLCMIPLALLSRYYIFFDKKVASLMRRNREVWDTIRTQGGEVIGLAPELRGHYAFEYGLKGLRDSFQRFRQVLDETASLQALFQAISPLVGVIQTGTLYWLGAALCIGVLPFASGAGSMSWGKVIEFMLIVQLFQVPSKDLGLFMGDWQMTRENRRRVKEYLDREVVFARREGGPQLPTASDVDYDGVSVYAPSGATMLNQINLTIEPGEHAAFCGPAGCGKTTAIQLIVRGAEPAAGRINLAGRGVPEYDLLSFARHVALVSQKPLLMDASIRNNILLGLRRDSDGSLKDEEGLLDVARLPGVSDLETLDAELYRVIRLVALEADVLRKCLDDPAPACPQSDQFRNRIGEIQATVADVMKQSGETEVIAFDFGATMPGSVSDNIFGPIATGRSPDDAVAELIRVLPAGEFLDQLQRVGYRRLRAERLAVAKKGESGAAAAQLRTDFHGTEASEELASAQLELARARDDGSPTGERELLGAALAADIEVAISYSRDRGGEAGANQFRSQIIEARKALAAAEPARKRQWEQLPSGKYIDQLTVRENLLRGRVNARIHGAVERVDGQIRTAIERLGLTGAAVHMGLESRVGEGGKYLSGGQRQKVAIARAVMKNPTILLLDEATASLDESSQAKITQLLREEFKQKTVISISHRLSTIRDFDRVIVLDRGEIVQAGSYDTLASTEGIFRDLVNQEQGTTGQAMAPQPVAMKPSPDGAPAFADLQRQLALSDVFASLQSEQLAFLASAARVVDCRPGEILFRRGDSGAELFLVLDGEVSFFSEVSPETSGGDIREVGSSGPGKVFGELALFGYGVRTLTARTGPSTRLLVLGREDLMRLMAADYRIAVALLRACAKRLIEVNERNLLAGKGAAAR